MLRIWNLYSSVDIIHIPIKYSTHPKKIYFTSQINRIDIPRAYISHPKHIYLQYSIYIFLIFKTSYIYGFE